MPDLYVQITGSFPGASQVEIQRTIEVEQKTLGRLFPECAIGRGPGWPFAHRAEAVNLVCAILKDALFQDQVTEVTIDNLIGLGTNNLHVNFKAGPHSVSVLLIGKFAE